MRVATSLSLLLAAAGARAQATATDNTREDGQITGALGDAPQVVDNPEGVVYQAVFPDEAFLTSAFPEGGNIEGSVTAEAAEGGLGVRFTIKLSNLPATGGPFAYHLHAKPVPEDGNCTATAAHLDPFERGQSPPCNATAPETCEVGDLSGKHGPIPEGESTFEASYVDLYASTLEGYEGYFGNLSVVVHMADSARLTCANFVRVDDGADDDDDDDDEDDDATATATTAAPSTAPTVPPACKAEDGSDATECEEATETGSAPTSVVTVAAAGLTKAGTASVAAVVGAAVLFML